MRFNVGDQARESLGSREKRTYFLEILGSFSKGRVESEFPLIHPERQVPYQIMWNNLNVSGENTLGGYLNNSDDSKKENAKRVDNIIPVMIKHLIHSDDELRLWGMDVRIVTFVGIVRNIERTTTKMTYEIEDETGNIKAAQWLETSNKSDITVNINTYVRIYGHMRVQNEIKYVLILKIVPMTNLNELTCHLLEVTNVMLKAEKIFNIQKNRTEPMKKSVANENGGLTSEQMSVFKVIQLENHTDNGIERNEIRTRVSASILPYLDEIINFLTSEGHIYTTLTDDHFKTT